MNVLFQFVRESLSVSVVALLGVALCDDNAYAQAFSALREPASLSYEELVTEEPVITSVTTWEGEKIEGDWPNLVLAYGLIEKDPRRKFKSSLNLETFAGVPKRTRLDVISSLDAKRQTNDLYVFDPVYVSAEGRWIFKYGAADKSLDAYKFFRYDEKTKVSAVLTRDQIRNRRFSLSPDFKHLQYLKGGGISGPEPEYFKEAITLWVSEISTGKSRKINQGDNLNDLLSWKSGKLIYSKVEEGADPEAGVDTFFSFDPATGLSKPIPNKNIEADDNYLSYEIHNFMLKKNLNDSQIRWPAKKKLPFEGNNYLQDTLFSDSSGLYFFIEVPMDAQQKESKKQSKDKKKFSWDQNFQLWKYTFSNNTFSKVLTLSITTSSYAARFRILAHSTKTATHPKETFLVTMMQAGEEVSPIVGSAVEVQIPAHVYSLLQLSDGETKTLWKKVNAAGLSVSINDGPYVTHPY